jgi:hypothetical protein
MNRRRGNEAEETLRRIEPLPTLDKLSPRNRPGLDKRWIVKRGSEPYDDLLHDCLQKINYSIQDFNATLEQFDGGRKDVIYLIVLSDWISDATDVIVQQCIDDEIASGFSYSNEDRLEDCRGYFRAVRSFVTAHPLKTTRHKEFGLDGNFICLDIRKQASLTPMHAAPFKRLTVDGLKQVNTLCKTDVVLMVYSKSDGARFFELIGIDMADLREFAALCIDKLYELDMYLAHLRKKDFRPAANP